MKLKRGDLHSHCPDCGYTAHLYVFDALGVADGELACPRCHLVDPMEEVSMEEVSDVKILLVHCKKCGCVKKILARPHEMTCIDLGRVVQAAIKEGDDFHLGRHQIIDTFCRCPTAKHNPSDDES